MDRGGSLVVDGCCLRSGTIKKCDLGWTNVLLRIRNNRKYDRYVEIKLNTSLKKYHSILRPFVEFLYSFKHADSLIIADVYMRLERFNCH